VYDISEGRVRAAAMLRWRPDWPFAVLIVLTWAALLAGAGGHDQGNAEPAADAPAHAHHHGSPGASPPAATEAGGDSSSGLPAALPDWTLMSVAMMAPVALPAMRHVGLNSIRSRRQWAMSVYFVVYVLVWVVFGTIVLTGTRLARDTIGVDGRMLIVMVLAVAAAWQLTRIKRRALVRCGRTVPLPPVGLRADAGCARFALLQGWRCVVSCWALMLVMAVVGHSNLVWMAALTGLVVAEELTLIGRRLLWASAAALALAAVLVVLGA
jgi:predicted metal-binding membrane protein